MLCILLGAYHSVLLCRFLSVFWGERVIMNAAKMNGMLKFIGGRPMLILRDHTEGRIKVYLGGKWVATAIPGHLMGLDCEAVLLGCSDEGYDFEERTTWGGVACALSEFQQTGDVPCMDADGFICE